MKVTQKVRYHYRGLSPRAPRGLIAVAMKK